MHVTIQIRIAGEPYLENQHVDEHETSRLVQMLLAYFGLNRMTDKIKRWKITIEPNERRE